MNVSRPVLRSPSPCAMTACGMATMPGAGVLRAAPPDRTTHPLLAPHPLPPYLVVGAQQVHGLLRARPLPRRHGVRDGSRVQGRLRHGPGLHPPHGHADHVRCAPRATRVHAGPPWDRHVASLPAMLSAWAAARGEREPMPTRPGPSCAPPLGQAIQSTARPDPSIHCEAKPLDPQQGQAPRSTAKPGPSYTPPRGQAPQSTAKPDPSIHNKARPLVRPTAPRPPPPTPPQAGGTRTAPWGSTAAAR